MNLRKIAQLTMAVFGLLALASLTSFVEIGALIWPVAIITIIASFYLVTNPSDKDAVDG